MSAFMLCRRALLLGLAAAAIFSSPLNAGMPTLLGAGKASAVAPLTGDALIDFTGMADGAPGNASTGEPIWKDSSATDNKIVDPVVSSGALVASGLSAEGTTTATYAGLKLREDIKSMYADVSFGHANDTVALIASAGIGLIPVVDSSLHIVFQAGTWGIDWWSNSSTTHETADTVSGPLNTKVRIGWRIVGNDIYILPANGVEVGPFTLANAATRTNHSVVFEHYRADGVAPSSKIYAVAANIFANPAAAGRTNIITQVNNLSNAAWTKGPVDITAGQTDADGGSLADKVLEQASIGLHAAFQPITKSAAAAKRFTARAKIKGIGRDWAWTEIYNGAFSGSVLGFYNITTRAIGSTSGTFLDQTFMAYDLGNGWVQVQCDFTSDADAGIVPLFGIASADGTSSYLGDAAKGAFIFDEQLYERPL